MVKTQPEFEQLALVHGKVWCFWLDKTKPHKPRDGTFRVSIVIENESGHYPTGGGDKDPTREPWWWDDETCEKVNAENGISVERAWEIVMSSMSARR